MSAGTVGPVFFNLGILDSFFVIVVVDVMYVLARSILVFPAHDRAAGVHSRRCCECRVQYGAWLVSMLLTTSIVAPPSGQSSALGRWSKRDFRGGTSRTHYAVLTTLVYTDMAPSPRYYGAVIPSILNVLSMQGYLVVITIVGGQTLAEVSDHLDATLGIVIIALISLIVCGSGVIVAEGVD